VIRDFWHAPLIDREPQPLQTSLIGVFLMTVSPFPPPLMVFITLRANSVIAAAV